MIAVVTISSLSIHSYYKTYYMGQVKYDELLHEERQYCHAPKAITNTEMTP